MNSKLIKQQIKVNAAIEYLFYCETHSDYSLDSIQKAQEELEKAKTEWDRIAYSLAPKGWSKITT